MAPASSPAARAVLAALALGACLALQGCGGSSKTTTTTVAPATTTTTTTFAIAGQCSAQQRGNGCASGFCNSTNGGTCQCLADYETSSSGCVKPTKPRKITFYMYRAQDARNFIWANDDTTSLAGAMWYLHNEVVVTSCPRHFNVTRVLRLKVDMYNTPEMYSARKSLFGPFATFDSGFCHDCVESIFSKYGYVVGCETPGGSENYTWAGYKPIWYSLPGACPSKAFKDKTKECEKAEPGGQCSAPDGGNACTWNYTDAGSVNVEELYGEDFDYKAYCDKLGGKGVAGEYDRTTDKGKNGISFWDGKADAVRNAKRVEALRAVFKRKYPDMPDLPEPWCDWAEPFPTPAQEVVDLVV